MAVFISYQWDSSYLVHELSKKLENEDNIKVWIDFNEMQPGDDVFREMENGIRESSLFIAFITRKYAKSVNCQREIKYANELKPNRCLYVMLEKGLDKENLNGIGLLIAGYYRLNAFKEENGGWSENLYKKFVDSIREMLEGRQLTLTSSQLDSFSGSRKIQLKAKVNGKYVCAENFGNKPLIANKSSASLWETFELSYNNDGTVSLKALVNQKYVTADDYGNNPLIANKDEVGLWEKFYVTKYQDGVYSFKAKVNDKFVTAENEGESSLIACRHDAGLWEVFYLTYLI